jgi:hypothetical protein
MAPVNSVNPYEAPASSGRRPGLPLADDRWPHWIGNTFTFYSIGMVYFSLLQCACSAVHLVQLPGVIMPFAWSTFTILAARTSTERVVAGANGIVMIGLLLPLLGRFAVYLSIP